MTYRSSGENQVPSQQRHSGTWNPDQGGGDVVAGSAVAGIPAIERLNREMARILGIEQLLLGSTGSGSYALSKDKTQAFYLLVDSALTELRDVVRMDLLKPLWMLNGWR